MCGSSWTARRSSPSTRPACGGTSSIRTDIDFYSSHRAQRSIRRADVVLLFFDCTQRLSKVDKQLCKYVADQYKPCIFVVNKWDLLVRADADRPLGRLPPRHASRTMWHVPIAFITGQTGKNVKALLNHAQMLFKQSVQRVSTSQAQQAGAGGARETSAAAARHPAAEDLLCDASQHAAADDRDDLQRAEGVHADVPAVPARYPAATTSISAKCRSRCTCTSGGARTSATRPGAGEDTAEEAAAIEKEFGGEEAERGGDSKWLMMRARTRTSLLDSFVLGIPEDSMAATTVKDQARQVRRVACPTMPTWEDLIYQDLCSRGNRSWNPRCGRRAACRYGTVRAELGLPK